MMIGCCTFEITVSLPSGKRDGLEVSFSFVFLWMVCKVCKDSQSG